MVDKIQKQSVIKNYVYNVSYQIINIIIPLITAPYISRTLGAENIHLQYLGLRGTQGEKSHTEKEIKKNIRRYFGKYLFFA